MILRIQRGPGRAIAVTAVVASLLGLATGYIIWGFPNRAAKAPSAATATESEPAATPGQKATPAPTLEPPCKLSITSEPPGASVKLGSKVIGTTPLKTKLPCETESVTISKDSFARKTVALALNSDDPGDAHAKLERRKINVTIKSRPAGATVWKDGKSAGKTPLRLKLPMQVETKIVLKRRGFRDQRATLKPKKSTSVTYRLKRR